MTKKKSIKMSGTANKKEIFINSAALCKHELKTNCFMRDSISMLPPDVRVKRPSFMKNIETCILKCDKTPPKITKKPADFYI